MWTAGPWWTGGQLLLGAALLALLPALDRLSWVVVAPLAGAALASGARDLLLRPTLAADADGLRLVQGVRRVHVRWAEVERLRTVRDRRTPLLELDLGDRVVVLPARRLGAPVEQVLVELERLRSLS